MTIDLAPDLARFVEDAVRTGGYNSPADVVRDALNRLQQVAATSDKTSESGFHEKPLTKQTLQQHLVDLGLVDQPVVISAGATTPPVEDEDEIISDIVIRERLIEWLVGFLPRS
jgi:Arc/MetJ-type ribon-helix-helix transcriptional regulator